MQILAAIRLYSWDSSLFTALPSIWSSHASILPVFLEPVMGNVPNIFTLKRYFSSFAEYNLSLITKITHTKNITINAPSTPPIKAYLMPPLSTALAAVTTGSGSSNSSNSVCFSCKLSFNWIRRSVWFFCWSTKLKSTRAPKLRLTSVIVWFPILERIWPLNWFTPASKSSKISLAFSSLSCRTWIVKILLTLLSTLPILILTNSLRYLVSVPALEATFSINSVLVRADW